MLKSLKKTPTKNKNPRLWGGKSIVPIYHPTRVCRSLRKLRPMRKLQLAAKVSVAAEAKAPWTKPLLELVDQRTDEDGGILRKLKRNIKNTKKTWGDSIYIYIYGKDF